jgi:hypothetical protein
MTLLSGTAPGAVPAKPTPPLSRSVSDALLANGSGAKKLTVDEAAFTVRASTRPNLSSSSTVLFLKPSQKVLTSGQRVVGRALLWLGLTGDYTRPLFTSA